MYLLNEKKILVKNFLGNICLIIKLVYGLILTKNKLKKLRKLKISNTEKDDFFKFLFKLGYSTNLSKNNKKGLLVKSFQRHFRQKLVNGKIDLECLFIAKKLSKIL